MGSPSRRRGGLTRLLIVAVALALPAACRAGGSTPPAAQPSAGAPAPGAPTPPQQASLTVGKALVIFGADTVVAEIARTSEERERGLMYRNEIPAGTGMLFVFPDSQERTFWMENTYVALDVAFMDASLAVVDIQQMEPKTTDYHDSKAPAMYALEVPKGWFAAHRVAVGTRAKMVVGAG